MASTPTSLGQFAAESDSDLRWIPVGTAEKAKAPMNVATGTALGNWQHLDLDADQLQEHLDQGRFQPRAIGINLKASGVAALDCDAEGWLEDLAKLAGCSAEELRKELNGLSFVTSPRVLVAARKAIKFVFRLPDEVLERFAQVKPGLQIVESDNDGKWALFAAGKQVVVCGEYDDHGERGNYSPTGFAEIREAPPLLCAAFLARFDQYSERATPTLQPAVLPDDLSGAIRQHLFPVAGQFSSYDSWLKTGMAFHALGDGYLALWVDFCREMGDSFDEGECLQKWESFERRDGGVGIGSLYYWLAKQGWRGGDAIKEEHPIATRIDLLTEGLLEIVRTVRSAWKRRAHADDLNDALGKPVKAGGVDVALAEAIASVREERSKTPRRASSWEAFLGEADEAAIVDWLVYGLIAKGDSHLFVAPAKEGKTSSLSAFLINALIGVVSPSEERIGSLLWFSDDQARAKTQSYLKAAARGVRPTDWADHLKHRFSEGGLVVDDRFSMTPDGIEELIEEVRQMRAPVVVIDSLASVCRKLGLKENDSSFANVIYDLGESVKEANPEATLIIIHHSSKSGMKDKSALESVRGSGAIVGAVDNVINITKPLKTSRGGNSAVADDLTPEREIHVNGRIPGGRYFVDLEFEMETVPHPQDPSRSSERLRAITLTRKAESTHQGASEVSLGSYQDRVHDLLCSDPTMIFTAGLVAEKLDSSPQQARAALKKMVERKLAEEADTDHGSGFRAKGKF